LTRPSLTSDLDSELQAAREELQALHELLEDLPSILEHKFQHRLQSALNDQRRLLGENEALRGSLAKLLPEGARPVAKPTPRLLLPPALERAGSLGQTLRQVLRRGRYDGAGANPAPGADPTTSSPPG
jgi:DNA repair exonuclease SbcCD ATPase subunit